MVNYETAAIPCIAMLIISYSLAGNLHFLAAKGNTVMEHLPDALRTEFGVVITHCNLLQCFLCLVCQRFLTFCDLAFDNHAVQSRPPGKSRNIVATIGGLDAQAEESIEEQIIHREQREKLLRQIESLEKQCRTEKQTRKKYELHQQIIKLKEELK